jgi:hypothetical protein
MRRRASPTATLPPYLQRGGRESYRSAVEEARRFIKEERQEAHVTTEKCGGGQNRGGGVHVGAWGNASGVVGSIGLCFRFRDASVGELVVKHVTSWSGRNSSELEEIGSCLHGSRKTINVYEQTSVTLHCRSSISS